MIFTSDEIVDMVDRRSMDPYVAKLELNYIVGRKIVIGFITGFLLTVALFGLALIFA